MAPRAADSFVRVRLTWAAALAGASVAAILAAGLHGRGSRIRFEPSLELQSRTVAAVGTAADALAIWRASGVRGRHLLILTGQWSRPQPRRSHSPAAEDLAKAGGDTELRFVDPQSALYLSAKLGIARTLDALMPPAPFSQQLGDVGGRKGLVRGDGSYTLTFNGFARTFSTLRGFVAPTEEVLVLIEPSWFTEGSAPDPLAWLRDHGVQWDLALLAMDDPSASEAERQAAAAYAQANEAPFLEAME